MARASFTTMHPGCGLALLGEPVVDLTDLVADQGAADGDPVADERKRVGWSEA
jgi:hypothetical protein